VALDDGQVAWVSGEYLEGDDSPLEVITEDEAIPYGPMQAFVFQSGIGDSPCASVPSSGLLIQTPEGRHEIHFLVNGIDIELGSTVYLQAEFNDYMKVFVIEGQAILTVGEDSQVVPAGTFSQVPLDVNGIANGAPEFPQGYTRVEVRSLPFRLLPDNINITGPLDEDEIELAINGPVLPTPEPPIGTAVSANKTVTLNGNEDWFDTGINITSGQTITFTASGSINIWPSCYTDGVPAEVCDTMTYSPDGGDYVSYEGRGVGTTPVTSAPYFSLVGRIGNSRFFIGSSRTFVANGNGTLYLRINDVDYNNVGSWTVTIDVQ